MHYKVCQVKQTIPCGHSGVKITILARWEEKLQNFG